MEEVMPPLNEVEYRALKEVTAKIDDVEAVVGPLRDLERYHDLDEMRAVMRAATEGYEAARRAGD